MSVNIHNSNPRLAFASMFIGVVGALLVPFVFVYSSAQLLHVAFTMWMVSMLIDGILWKRIAEREHRMRKMLEDAAWKIVTARAHDEEGGN